MYKKLVVSRYNRKYTIAIIIYIITVGNNRNKVTIDRWIIVDDNMYIFVS